MPGESTARGNPAAPGYHQGDPTGHLSSHPAGGEKTGSQRDSCIHRAWKLQLMRDL